MNKEKKADPIRHNLNLSNFPETADGGAGGSGGGCTAAITSSVSIQ